ncbi:MAG: hypothetical protein JXO22_06680 [Phycisphaerae bacterium]|nr:hypothetical protein [Phycisphaerae bacterium]
MNNRHLYKAMRLMPFVLVGIIPWNCASPLLKSLTPILLNDGNGFLQEVIKAVAPLVLP